MKTQINEYKFLECKSVGFLMKQYRDYGGYARYADENSHNDDCVKIFNQESNVYVDVPKSVIKSVLDTKRHVLNKKEGRALIKLRIKQGV